MLISFFVSPHNALATLSSSTDWEVRGGAGNDNNGGCFTRNGSGTDYSQQDSAQLSLTDFATSGTGVTTLTSATGGFTSAMVDNCINLSSGTNLTTGFYRITGYTDTNTVTLDRAPDDGVGGVSGATGAVGGALNTITKAVDNFVGCNYVWIKAATYGETITINGGVCGTSNATSFIGYNSTRQDDPKLTNRPVIDAASTRANCININGNYDGFAFYNLICQDATGDGITGSSLSTGNFLYNIRSTGNGGWGISSIGHSSSYYVEADNNSSGGFTNNNSCFYCYFHDNSGVGSDTSGGATIAFSVADSNSDDGFETGNTTSLLDNVSYNNTGSSSDGFSFNDNTTGAINNAINNISSSNGNYGYNKEVGGRFYIVDYNLDYNNTTGDYSGMDPSDMQHGDNSVRASNPSFTDPSNGDFTLSSSSSPATGAGTGPGTWTNVVGDYKINIGVDQDDNTTGGGGASSYTYVQ